MQKGKYYRMRKELVWGAGILATLLLYPGCPASFFHSFWENERYGRYAATGGVHFYGV